MPRSTGPFLIAAAAGVATLTAASAPSPLYPVYQHLWHFSATTLTLVFAVYVFALIAALVTVGSLSDLVGRRPVASGALVLLAVGMLLFAVADGPAGLMVARVVQGLAVGAATGTTTAMMTESAPDARTGSVVSSSAAPLGIAVGAVLAGALVEFAPFPRQLVFWVLGAVYLLLAALVWLVPETIDRDGSSWRTVARSLVPSVGVPPEVRSDFAAILPSTAATWALAGLYLSLGSSVIGQLLGVTSHFTVSLVLAAFFASGIPGSVLQETLPVRVQRWAGLATLAVGVTITVVATLVPSLPLYVVGSVASGLGFGAAFRTALGSLAGATPAARRGQVFAAMYVASYVAFSVPALLAGVVVGLAGLRVTTVGYGVFDLVLIALAVLLARRGARSADARD